MMFITHFNKLIRNKILWSCFAVIVVLSFVMWTTQTGGSRAEQQINRIGKLDGKAVPAEEFQSAYFHSLLSMSLMLGKPLQVNAQVDEALRSMAWRRLVSLRAAKSLRIPVAGDEVVAAIQQQPYFSVNGRFQPDRYAAFVQRFLAGLQTTEAQFEEHIRQELVLSKAKYLLAQAAWVAPLETEQVLHQLYDTFVVSYVALEREELDLSVKIAADQAQAYFEGHREQFTVPEKMRVKWVAFPFDHFLDEGGLDEAALRSYYEDNIERFTVRGSNDQLVAVPFDAVEDDLRITLALENAVIQAGDRASDFEVALAPDRAGRAPSFEDAARAAGLSVSTSAFFAVRQPIPNLEANLAFSKAAFELRRTPDDYFSHALKGSNAYYLLAIADRTDSRVPDYAEARDDVIAAATDEAVAAKLEQLARCFYDLAVEAAAKGVPLAKALRRFGLEVATTEPFSVKEGFEGIEFTHLAALVKEVLTHNTGEMTGLIPVKTGYVFGHVDSRAPASRGLSDSARADISRYIRNRREGLVFGEWQEYLLASAKFEDLSPKRKAVPAVEADGESSAEDQAPEEEE